MACGRLLDLVQPEVDLFDPPTPKTLPTVGLPRTYPLWRYHHSKFSKWEVCGSSVGRQLYTYSTLHFRNVAREQEAKLPLGQPNVLPHSTFGVTWRHRWRDHLIPYISYWWSFGTKPLSLTVSDILNIECNAMLDDLDTTSKQIQMSRSFILVPIDFSYTTSYYVNIALGRTG